MTHEAQIQESNRLRDEIAHKVADAVDANELERQSILRLSRLTRYGSESLDLAVRVDGTTAHFELDWIARLLGKGPL